MTINEALDELNDATKGHSQYAVATDKGGVMSLVRIDSVRPIRVLHLGKNYETAADRILTAAEWVAEMGLK